MSEILGITVPEYPDSDREEPSYLFCSNFLLHREYGNDSIYYGLGTSEETPLERLIETIHALHLVRLPVGTPLQPGDITVIFDGARQNMVICHSMIVLTPAIWFGASNHLFFSRILKNARMDSFMPRDAIAIDRLRPDYSSYTFGQFTFDAWRSPQATEKSATGNDCPQTMPGTSKTDSLCSSSLILSRLVHGTSESGNPVVDKGGK